MSSNPAPVIMHEDNVASWNTHSSEDCYCRCTELSFSRITWNNHHLSGAARLMWVLVTAHCNVISCSFYCQEPCVFFFCVCVCVHLCVSLCWLELIIICKSSCVYVPTLPALWQAESECAHNKWGASKALYFIIPLHGTPNGRKQCKSRLMFAYITTVTSTASSAQHVSLKISCGDFSCTLFHFCFWVILKQNKVKQRQAVLHIIAITGSLDAIFSLT